MRKTLTLVLSGLCLAGIVTGCGNGGREVDIEVAPEHLERQQDNQMDQMWQEEEEDMMREQPPQP